MKRVVILYEKINEAVLNENVIILKKMWESMGYEVKKLVVQEEESSETYMRELVSLKEDFLITFAMAGFSWLGWMEQVRFNVLATMQIHILIGNLSYYDYYLQKEYGIHTFFFTDCEEIFDNWKSRYRHVPFMAYTPVIYIAEQLTEEEKRRNHKAFQDIVESVLAFIEKPSVI